MMLTVESSMTSPSSTVDDGRHKKLKDAAQQFEAMMLQEMLKPIREEGRLTYGGNDDEPYGDTLSSFGTESLAGSIARRGGVGIATSVLREVEREDASRTVSGRVSLSS